jgi:spore maturation protein CgeB
MKIAIIGVSGGTHLGSSFVRAAERSGSEIVWFDTNNAMQGARLLSALSWRLDHRPLHLRRFSTQVIETCAKASPDVVVAVGAAPVIYDDLQTLRKRGAVCIAYCTDDPWNRTSRARWYLSALPAYDIVFTPRRANITDFRALGCPDVRYLPFGYDQDLFADLDGSPTVPSYDILFVGGADHDRLGFMRAFLSSGSSIALVGGYWDRFPETRPYALGQKTPHELSALTIGAKVNLCLVRRANRDGHVMRSFEIAAIGGCMLAEDTPEHREIFGADGECVVYFTGAAQAAERATALIGNPKERDRLSQAVRKRVGVERNTYQARLHAMLDAAHNIGGTMPVPTRTIVQ